jgi:dTDP-glucose pyrophosphorylase
MAEPRVDKAVVLAAGRGSRMQRSASGIPLDGATTAAVQAGRKTMIPLHGRPFLDYVLHSLLEVGYAPVCLVVAPGADDLRRRYGRMAALPGGPPLRFAVQARPRGTADALLAARDFTGEDPFLVVNGDNLYPRAVLERLRAEEPPALPAFEPEGLLEGNVPRERLSEMALLRIGPDGALEDIVEKPGPGEMPAESAVSMNIWTFTPAIFEACRAIHPHPVRGEVELPVAVRRAVQEGGMRFHTFPVRAPVWDLTRATDIERVARALADLTVLLPEVGA